MGRPVEYGGVSDTWDAPFPKAVATSGRWLDAESLSCTFFLYAMGYAVAAAVNFHWPARVAGGFRYIAS